MCVNDDMFGSFRIDCPSNLLQNGDLPYTLRIGHFDRNGIGVPLLIPFAGVSGICFETDSGSRSHALRQMEYMALGLLGSVASEAVNLIFVDISLNTNFPIMCSFDSPNVKFVTNRDSLRNELSRIQENARYISTKCLGYNYADLREYNGSTEFKEPYNILFVSNFPKDFTDSEIDTVALLMEEGEKCGVRVIMNIERQYFPEDNAYNKSRYSRLYKLCENALRLDCTVEPFRIHNLQADIISDLLLTGSFRFDSYDVQSVSRVIDAIKGNDADHAATVADFISIPIGRSGKERVSFEMGRKSGVYHGFIAGQSGTGKSTLLNNIITSIAERYSPDEFRLYLLDYKWGVEFQVYQNHPNVELLLLDNENLAFGIEVFLRLQREIIERARLFRELGQTINNIDEYNQSAEHKLPRILMIVDEVQQLFVNYETRKHVNPLVKEIAKQGRAFGVHMLFSSQSYTDCHIDADALNQMSLRIAFGLANGSECRAILGADNHAPMKLKPYTAIYNSKNGDKDYNVLVKMDNFSKEDIAPVLAAAANKYSCCKPFEREIIVKHGDERNVIGSEHHAVKVVARKGYEDRDFQSEFGF